MLTDCFETRDSTPVPAVTADEMQEVDRIAVEEIGLSLARMMEHAGRSLALRALAHLPSMPDTPLVILAGAGGNGGGGLVCARHLANRSIPTRIVLDRDPAEVTGVTGEQLGILQAGTEVHIDAATDIDMQTLPDPSVVIDAILGYGLEGVPRGSPADLVAWTNETDAPIISLDVPTGIDATTGERPGTAIEPDETLTLALPKTGLTEVRGELFLADLSIPARVYERLDIPDSRPFDDQFLVELRQQ